MGMITRDYDVTPVVPGTKDTSCGAKVDVVGVSYDPRLTSLLWRGAVLGDEPVERGRIRIAGARDLNRDQLATLLRSHDFEVVN